MIQCKTSHWFREWDEQAKVVEEHGHQLAHGIQVREAWTVWALVAASRVHVQTCMCACTCMDGRAQPQAYIGVGHRPTCSPGDRLCMPMCSVHMRAGVIVCADALRLMEATSVHKCMRHTGWVCTHMQTGSGAGVHGCSMHIGGWQWHACMYIQTSMGVCHPHICSLGHGTRICMSVISAFAWSCTVGEGTGGAGLVDPLLCGLYMSC